MRRLFISLYVALGIAFLVCVLAVPWVFNTSLKRPLEHYGERLAVAPQFLFEQELRDVPQLQWPEHMYDLQRRFGYKLVLRKLDEIEADKQQLELLRRGQPISPSKTFNQIEVMFLPIRGSDYVVEMHLSESEPEKAQRSLGGIFYLVEKHLSSIAPTQRAAELQSYSKQFGIPLQLVTEAQAELTPQQLQILREHRVVGIDINATSGERYFKQLDDDSAILKIGPLPVPTALRFVTPVAYGAFAAVLAAIAFLWLRPLWRDMRRLDQRAAEFGSGQLTARVEVPKRSSIKVLADAFNSMADQIQALITNQREISHAVSHELRTPLARLRFTIDMLGNAANDADRNRYIAGMHVDIRELEALVDESLSYARLTSPTMLAAQTESVAIADWLEEVLDANHHAAGSILVTSELEISSATAEFDRRLFGRALQNLVQNAIQYAKTRVHVIATNRNGFFELMVDDDGSGVPLEQRETIFIPFHRVDSSRSRETGGYGLGLAIVKRICELHRAEIVVEDSPLGGARFRISFRIQEAS